MVLSSPGNLWIFSWLLSFHPEESCRTKARRNFIRKFLSVFRAKQASVDMLQTWGAPGVKVACPASAARRIQRVVSAGGTQGVPQARCSLKKRSEDTLLCDGSQ